MRGAALGLNIGRGRSKAKRAGRTAQGTPHFPAHVWNNNDESRGGSSSEALRGFNSAVAPSVSPRIQFSGVAAAGENGEKGINHYVLEPSCK
jgi:hypothetical protein